MGVEEGNQRLAIAKRQLDKVQDAAWEEDPEDAVTWAFYAYENCVTAIAALHNRRWTRNHREKAELAKRFYREGLISKDISDTLELLNNLRKDVAYEQPGPELLEQNLDVLATDLAELIDEIQSIIEASE